MSYSGRRSAVPWVVWWWCFFAAFALIGCGDGSDHASGDSVPTDTDNTVDDDSADDDADPGPTPTPIPGESTAQGTWRDGRVRKPVRTLDAISSATPGVDDAIIGPDDPNCYRRSLCGRCHRAVHDGGYDLVACARCHGNADAKKIPAEHAPFLCRPCHPTYHAGMGFESPGDCFACHPYEDTGGDCPVTRRYDVVVIGAGGGGLAAAARLSRAGLRVALVEQHYKVGGCMSDFRRKDYHFEVSLHAMDGVLAPDGMNYQLFRDLGILNRITPVRLDPMYVAAFPDLTLSIPADVDAYQQLLKQTFPVEAANIDRLFADMAAYDEVMVNVYALFRGLDWEAMMGLLSRPGPAARLLALMNTSLSDFLDEYTTDERLRAVWSQLAIYLGVEPERLSAMMFVVMWNSYHRHGSYYFEGGSQSISDAYAQVIREYGGDIYLNSKVTKLDIESGRVARAHTDGEGCFAADWFISNAGAPATLFDLVGREYLPADYVADVEAMTTGKSAFAVYLGVDHDYTRALGGAHQVMFSASYDPAENLQFFEDGDIERTPGAVANFSAIDPTAAPPGKNALCVITQLPYEYQDAWKWDEGYGDYVDLKGRVGKALVERAEAYLPDLRRHLEVVEVATPRTVEMYTGNPRGSIFGWEHTIEQSMSNRLPNHTPIDNLYLAGAWTLPGAGQSAVMQSGYLAAGMVLKRIEEGP